MCSAFIPLQGFQTKSVIINFQKSGFEWCVQMDIFCDSNCLDILLSLCNPHERGFTTHFRTRREQNSGEDNECAQGPLF